MGMLGNESLKFLTPCSPSAKIKGVPASSQSTPALKAIDAVSMASSIFVKSRDI